MDKKLQFQLFQLFPSLKCKNHLELPLLLKWKKKNHGSESRDSSPPESHSLIKISNIVSQQAYGISSESTTAEIRYCMSHSSHWNKF